MAMGKSKKTRLSFTDKKIWLAEYLDRSETKETIYSKAWTNSKSGEDHFVGREDDAETITVGNYKLEAEIAKSRPNSPAPLYFFLSLNWTTMKDGGHRMRKGI